MSVLRTIMDLIRELRRRHVFRVVAAYLVVAWLVIQVVVALEPSLGLPGWTDTLVIVLVGVGLPIAVVLSWALEVSPEGVRVTRTTDGAGAGAETAPALDGPGTEPPDAELTEAAAILDDALELPEARRGRFVRDATAGNGALRHQVFSLLRARGGTGRFDRMAEWPAPGRPPSDAVPPPVAGQDIAHYRLLERLGDGGTGIVFRARDLRLEREVALKLLPRHLSVDLSAEDRFTVEARAAAALDHPNICALHEFGETDSGWFFIARAYHEGETLESVLARDRPPVPRAVDLATEIASGLAHAHAHEVVHGHLEPSSIIVTAGGRVKVLDFGPAATVADVTVTRPGTRMGTLAYMSPEQTRAEPLDARTDVWSLGVVLYEMIAGRPPFGGGSDRATLAAIRGEDPSPLRDLRPETPPGLEKVVSRALARDAGERYRSAAALLSALEDVDLEAAPPALAHQALDPEGERRLTCVMAVRLAEFADLVERLSPDRLEEVSERVRTWTRDIVEMHGGVVNEVGEEELVSLFGVPVTHEDDPLRAARAATGLRERAGGAEARWEKGSERPGIQVGLAAGRVVARPGDSTDGPPYRISGGAYALARRLSALAAPGDILVTEECVRLLQGHFETEAREPVSRGEGEPDLRPYRVQRELEPRTPLEAAELEGLTAYVGREREMEALESACRSATEGTGRVVVVEGEAGVGKSRLLHEFRRSLTEEPVRVLRGRCRPESTAAPYGPFIEALWDLLNLDPEEGGTGRPDRVARRIRAISPDLEDRTPFYLHLLSIDDPRRPVPAHLEREHLRVAIHESLVAAFTVAARETPTVLMLEDWHWRDHASEEVLDGLGEMVTAHPLLIVVTRRPRSDLEWKGALPHDSIQMAPLTAEACGAVVRDVLGAASVPEALQDTLHERTEGNPFFLEEVCRTLLEEDTVRVDEAGGVALAGPLDRLGLPGTVQGVIRTRLDRLDVTARRLLLTASVLGREFDRKLLEDIWRMRRNGDPGPGDSNGEARTTRGAGHADRDGGTPGNEAALEEALDTLRKHGLVQRVRVVPEPAYRFKHALTQEVAYDTLLLRRRRELHAAAGRALERRLDEHEAEQPDLLAHHFSRAEDWKRAVRYGQAATERAMDLSQYSEALRSAERTKDWVERLSDPAERHEARIEMLLTEERLCEVLGLRDRQQELIDELVSILEGGEPDARLAEVYLRQGDLCTLLRRFEEAESALRRSLAIAQEREDQVAERSAFRSLALMLWHQDRNDEAMGTMEKALALDRERGDREAITGDLANIGTTLISKGDLGEALEVLHEALRLAKEIGNPVKQVFILHHLGSLHREKGETEEAIRYLEEAIELGDIHRLPIQQSFHLTKMAQIELERGQLEAAIEDYREAVELNRQAGAAEALAQSLRMLGDAFVTHDRFEEALAPLREAAELFGRLGLHQDRALMFEHLALANEQVGYRPEAAEAWSRLGELHRERGDTEGELEALEGLARCLREDEPDRALAIYDRALDAARRLELPAKEGELLNAAGIVEWERGEYGAALERYRSALEIFRAVGDEDSQGLILNSVGVTLSRLGRPDEARRRLQTALEAHRRRGASLLEGHALAALAELDLDAGDTAAARERFEASLRIRRELGDRRGEGWMLHGLARVALASGENSERAADYLRRAEEIGGEVPDPELVRESRALRS